jgi:hypothetical protein
VRSVERVTGVEEVVFCGSLIFVELVMHSALPYWYVANLPQPLTAK